MLENMIRVGRAVCTRINRLDRKLLFFSFMLLLVGRLPALHNFPPAAAFPSRLHSQMPCQSTLNIYHTRSFASRLILILPKDNAEQSERISTVKKICKYPPVHNFALSSHKKARNFPDVVAHPSRSSKQTSQPSMQRASIHHDMVVRRNEANTVEKACRE
jgi:hypothetical protein